MLKPVILVFICIFFSYYSVAQQWLGISGSNYAGSNSTYTNPANIADSRYKLYVNLLGNDAFLSNNYVGWNAPYSIISLMTNGASKEYRNARNQIVFKESYWDKNPDNTDYHIHVIDEFRGPSLQYTIDNKHSVGVLTRVKSSLHYTGITADIADLILSGTHRNDIKYQLYSLPPSAMNVNSYAEIGFSYGQVLRDQDEDFMKVGITLKRVIGTYAAHLALADVKYEIIDDASRFDKDILKIAQLKANYAYTTDGAFASASPSLGWLLGNQSAGRGWGLDLGFVYEYRPNLRKFSYRDKGVLKLDASKNKYLYRIGISLLDFGTLNYDNPNYVKTANINTANVNVNATDFDQVKGFEDTFKRINTVFGAVVNTNSFKSSLPTCLQINVDYHIQDKFYLNAVVVQSLRSNQSIGMMMPSLLAFTPRWEHKWFEVSLPLALLDNYSVFTFGLASRFGPLFIGTDNLGSMLNINKPRGTDLYFGAFIPIFSKAPTLPNACFYQEPEKKSLKESLMFWKKRRYH